MTTTSSAPRRAGIAQAILLLAAASMPVMAATLITPVLPQLLEHFADVAGAAVLVPMIVSAPALMVAVFAPFAGQIVDRVGRKWLLIIALVAYAAIGVVPAFIDGLTGILVSRLVLGVCDSAIMTVATALLIDYFQEERTRNRYLGLQAATAGIGATLFIVIGTALGASGWQAPFWVYLISVAIAVPALWLLWEPSAGGAAAAGEPVRPGRIAWRPLIGPLLVTVVGGIAFYVLPVNLPVLIGQAGVAATNTAVIGGLAALASVFVMLGGLLFQQFQRRLGDRVVPLGFALQAVGILALWVMSGAGVAGIVPGALIASFGSGLLLPGFLTWVVARAGFAERGRVTGVWTASFFLGNFLAPLVANGLGAAFGSLVPAIGIIGIAALAMAVISGVGARSSKGAAAVAAA
ncbi:MFS transporter [Leucobacter allii]|uniref:MFS transporter n=1 Tax=Leucobacter allii TaxID=2932247 RepID=A0ABY4FMC5_9MICO|nr:MFS transporter [Leucobacter allii]UOQ57423.1 MFS transporter [Leucobacter allii]